MADDILKITNSSSKIVHGEDRKNQTLYEHFDNRKARQFLCWQPQTNWAEGVRKTGEWIKEARGYKGF